MRSKMWTEKEIEFLKENYGKYGSKYCSTKLERTSRACKKKANSLHIVYIDVKYKVENITDIVNNSTTHTECIIKLGLSPKASGNFQTLKKYIKIYNLDISHFKSGYQPNHTFTFKIPLSDILVKNSTYSRTLLKERLYKEGLKEKKCEICGQDEIWNDTILVHILDHVNGDCFDNRLENLRIVCPNCNSSLPTNCGKNKVTYLYDSYKKKYFSDKTHKKCECGRLILINSKKCNSCNGFVNRNPNRPTYETLLEDLKTMTYVAVGKKYNVSDNAIRKWLNSYKKHSSL